MAALHTEQLAFLLSRLASLPGRTESAGVYAADRLPAHSKMNSSDICFIVNTDTNDGPGAHWLAFYYDHAKRCLEYFDSFGLPLSFHQNVYRTLNNQIARILPINKYGMLQALETTACGYYCILYLHYRTHNCSGARAIREIAKMGRSAPLRDAAVVRHVHALMHKHKCSNLPTSNKRNK